MKTKAAKRFTGHARALLSPFPYALLTAVLQTGLCLAQPENPRGRHPARPAPEQGRREKGLQILYPLEGTLFPPEISAPEFRWKDKNASSDLWRMTIKFSDADQNLHFFSADTRWRPSKEVWETIKKRTLEKSAVFTVSGVGHNAPDKILSAGTVSFSTSGDEVGAQIFYREVPLPFDDAFRDPSRIRWRLGSVSSGEQPPVVLENLPVCGNCHSFSSDGSVLGMDVDYANDKGSYIIAPAQEKIVLDKEKIITWSDYKRNDKEPTFGLLSQVSPDGRHVISTVKDRSVFVARPDLAFSQLFFPVKGVLAVYSRKDKAFHALPGADDKAYVQSNPAWSPDGRHIVFARQRAYRLKELRNETATLLDKAECGEFLNGGKKFLFDLYKIPFNDGKGGRPEPLKGAAGNGMSNFFPKFSPDGKWIVFCKAKSFMLLQPDSELYILPAGGGEARRMRCNTLKMNSWHSWSPNGRWLVFASKANSPYTQLFLTHVDNEGRDTPPVLLDKFTSPDRAANIPEFVAKKGSVIKKLFEKFLDDVSFLRAGLGHAQAGDTENAISKYRKALELNPNNPLAHMLLGISEDAKGNKEEAFLRYTAALERDPSNSDLLAKLGVLISSRGDLDGAIAYYRRALKIKPDSVSVHYILAGALGMQSQPAEDKNRYQIALRTSAGYTGVRAGSPSEAERQLKLEEAIKHYRIAVGLQPGSAPMHTMLALALETRGRLAEAVVEYRETVKLVPEAAVAHNDLASALEAQGSLEEAITQYREAIKLEPKIAPLRMNLGGALERQGKIEEAVIQYREALRLDPDMKEGNLKLNDALQRLHY